MRGQDQQSGINPACLWLRKHSRRSFKKTVLGLHRVVLYRRNVPFSSVDFQHGHVKVRLFEFFILKKKNFC